MSIGPSPLCFDCAHMISLGEDGTFRCEAFPQRIPHAILVWVHDHHETFPGDNGVTFEPKDDAARAEDDQREAERLMDEYLGEQHESVDWQSVPVDEVDE